MHSDLEVAMFLSGEAVFVLCGIAIPHCVFFTSIIGELDYTLYIIRNSSLRSQTPKSVSLTAGSHIATAL